MNDDNFKNLVEESLKTLSQNLDKVTTNLDKVSLKLDKVSTDLQEVKNTQETQVLPSIATIETEIKTYADMYKHSLR